MTETTFVSEAHPFEESEGARDDLPALERAEGVRGFLVLVDRGLAAGQLVDDDALLDQEHAAEAEAGDVGSAAEVKQVGEEVAVALARDGLQVELVAFALALGGDAFLHAGVEVVGVDRGAGQEAAQDIGVVEDRDVRIAFRVELHLLQLGDRGLVRHDLVEGPLRFLEALPGTVSKLFPPRQHAAASRQGGGDEDQAGAQLKLAFPFFLLSG